MIRITIACVGKLKEKYLRDAEAEFTKRLGGLLPAGDPVHQ